MLQRSNHNKAFDLINLTPLMEMTSGNKDIVIGLLDGPIRLDHPDLMLSSIKELKDGFSSGCIDKNSPACFHGTFIAGILCGNRNSLAPAICPDCTLLIRPIFSENILDTYIIPNTSQSELADAIMECIGSGANIINLSIGLLPASRGDKRLEEALHFAAQSNVILVAAAGNQQSIGSSVITRHPWVLPVVACNLEGTPSSFSNLGASIGKRGVMAPGELITSLSDGAAPQMSAGTSIATAFITGAIALLWSEFPELEASTLKDLFTRPHPNKRKTIVPPLPDTWATYKEISKLQVNYS